MSQPSGNQNGATITISTPLSGTVTLSNAILVYSGTGSPGQLGSNSTLQNVQITGGSAPLTLADSATTVTISQCTFPGLTAYASPSNVTISTSIIQSPQFTGIYINPPGNNIVITDNHFVCDGTNCHEGIHMVMSGNAGQITGLNVSYNEITGQSRHGIEMQVQGANAICQGNYIHKQNLNPGDSNNQTPTESGIGISWACGPSSTSNGQPASGAYFSTNAQITGNVIDYTDGAWTVPINVSWSQAQGIEFMGNGGLVSNNWVKNTGYNAYTWTNGFTSQNNVWIGYTGPSVWNSEPGENSPTAPTISGDQSFALTASNIPAKPTAGPRYTPGYGNATTVTNIPLTLTNNADGSFTTAWTIPSGITTAPTITIQPTSGSSSMLITLTGIPVGTTSVKIGNIPASWVVTSTVSYGASYSGSANIQVTGGPSPSSNNTWSPQVEQVNSPPPAATPKHTIVTYTDGTLSLDGGTRQ